jgi:hypothetical protein
MNVCDQDQVARRQAGDRGWLGGIDIMRADSLDDRRCVINGVILTGPADVVEVWVWSGADATVETETSPRLPPNKSAAGRGLTRDVNNPSFPLQWRFCEGLPAADRLSIEGVWTRLPQFAK